MGYRVYDLATQGTTVDLFGPDAFSIENGKKDGVYHLRHFESVDDDFARPMTVDPELI